MRHKLKFLILGVFAIIISINSCEKEYIFSSADNPIEEFAEFIKYWYFWNDSLPKVNLTNYSNPEDLLEDIRYSKDKWSYISTKQEENEYYNEGTYIGHGFAYAADNDGKVRISYVFQSSDLANDAITRGWKINKINGTSVDENSNISDLLGSSDIGVSNTFEFESPAAAILTRTYSKKEITINTVLYRSVITVGAKKVGYIVFESFINPSKTELNNAFTYFKSQGVTELIVDLRYNGGGLMDIANHLAGLIIPDRLNDDLFLKYIHNKDRTSQNGSYKFKVNSNSLKLERVYFITTNGSASASEALINGLKPYLEVYMVGDNSYGKPVGMYSFESRLSDYVYVPITFKIVNSEGIGDYYEGLSADAFADDDVTHDFGDIQESSLAEALNHIQYGSFTGKKSINTIKRMPKKRIRTLREELGAY
jgi:carboxyl-terminal processing protease